MADDLLFTEVRSTSTGVKGRCITSARTNHWVIDLTAIHGGPGEETTPGEAFLGGVIGCGVLLIESFAGDLKLPLARVQGSIRAARTKADPSWFTAVDLRFELSGVDAKQAETLVGKFKAG